MPFWQFFRMGLDGSALLVPPSIILHRNSKNIFVLGADLSKYCVITFSTCSFLHSNYLYKFFSIHYQILITYLYLDKYNSHMEDHFDAEFGVSSKVDKRCNSLDTWHHLELRLRLVWDKECANHYHICHIKVKAPASLTSL